MRAARPGREGAAVRRTHLMKLAAVMSAVTCSALGAELPSDAGRPSAEAAIASAFLTNFLEARYAEANALLGASAKEALSPERLRDAWAGTMGSLGPLKARVESAPVPQEGTLAFVTRLEFEKGAWLAMVAVGVSTRKVEGFRVKPAPPAGPPAAYVDASRFSVTNLTVGRAPFELGATLTVPQGAGPFPGVVLVHGSGPNDRDESIGGYALFRDLAEGLSSRGIAVLRYDKRSLLHGAKMQVVTPETDTVDDAVVAINLLKARPEVDPSRVFVVGHSQGAFLAPEIARRAGAAGAVLLAPPFRKPWDLVVQQLKYLEAPAEQQRAIGEQMKLLKSGKATGNILGAPASFWTELARRDAVGEAKKLHKPVLVLWGTRDYQVIAADIAGWRAGLRGVKGASVVEVPGANHHFVFGTEPSRPAEYEQPAHAMPEVVDRLSSFIAPTAK